ncbi:MAG: hypothetical protein HUU28_13300 [Planctomycetaceae bacterium]|jgi:hypothetical protein|nr:hypothetical protein [Planctomycetaceae bacterium]
MFRHLALAACALGLAFGLAGCDASSASESAQNVGNTAIVLQSPVPAEPLLRKMSTAATDAVYRGVRRVEQHWTIAGQALSSTYREEVASDGRGRWSLETVELVAPTLASPQQDLWRMLQESREGFLFRYRDFRLFDVAQMATNYTTLLTGNIVDVAGRSCVEMVSTLRLGRGFTYNLCVDRESGLVLRCEQVAPNGARMGLVEFESIEFTPVFPPDQPWHVVSNDERPLPAGQAAAQLVGFEPVRPLRAQPRFRVLESTVVTSPDPNQPGTLAWVKTTLTDGIEVVFVLQGGPDSSVGVGDVVRVSPSVGPWNHVEGVLSGQRLMAMGRVSVDDLLDLLDENF